MTRRRQRSWTLPVLLAGLVLTLCIADNARRETERLGASVRERHQSVQETLATLLAPGVYFRQRAFLADQLAAAGDGSDLTALDVRDGRGALLAGWRRSGPVGDPVDSTATGIIATAIRYRGDTVGHLLALPDDQATSSAGRAILFRHLLLTAAAWLVLFLTAIAVRRTRNAPLRRLNEAIARLDERQGPAALLVPAGADGDVRDLVHRLNRWSERETERGERHLRGAARAARYFEELPAAALVTDEHGNIEEINGRGRRYLLDPARGRMPRHLDELLQPGSFAGLRSALSRRRPFLGGILLRLRGEGTADPVVSTDATLVPASGTRPARLYILFRPAGDLLADQVATTAELADQAWQNHQLSETIRRTGRRRELHQRRLAVLEALLAFNGAIGNAASRDQLLHGLAERNVGDGLADGLALFLADANRNVLLPTLPDAARIPVLPGAGMVWQAFQNGTPEVRTAATLRESDRRDLQASPAAAGCWAALPLRDREGSAGVAVWWWSTPRPPEEWLLERLADAGTHLCMAPRRHPAGPVAAQTVPLSRPSTDPGGRGDGDLLRALIRLGRWEAERHRHDIRQLQRLSRLTPSMYHRLKQLEARMDRFEARIDPIGDVLGGRGRPGSPVVLAPLLRELRDDLRRHSGGTHEVTVVAEGDLPPAAGPRALLRAILLQMAAVGLGDAGAGGRATIRAARRRDDPPGAIEITIRVATDAAFTAPTAADRATRDGDPPTDLLDALLARLGTEAAWTLNREADSVTVALRLPAAVPAGLGSAGATIPPSPRAVPPVSPLS